MEIHFFLPFAKDFKTVQLNHLFQELPIPLGHSGLLSRPDKFEQLACIS